MSEAGFTRRAFLRTSALGVASLSTGLMSCAQLDSMADLSGGALEFLHAVASGDPIADSVILWSRITPAEATEATSYRIGFEVAQDADFKQIIRQGVVTTSAAYDFCVKVDATGLKPNHRYWYRFSTADKHSPVGVTRTLPAEGVATDRLKMAVFSCSNWAFGNFHAYAEAAKRSDDIDLALHLGDYLYEYPKGKYPSAKHVMREHVPDNELLTLADYRQRYAQYRTDKNLQAIHSRLPFICVWDDHEIANNTWRTGAQNHNKGEGDFALRVQAAVQAYREWMPIRPAEPAHQIFRSFQFGDLAGLHMLDTRYIGRTKQLEYKNYYNKQDGIFRHADLRTDLHDASRSLLGDEQQSWLKRVVGQNQAKWQILGQQVLMGKYVLPSAVVLRQMLLPEFQVITSYLDEQAKPRNSKKVRKMRREHSKLLADQKKIAQVKASLPTPINLDAWDGYHRAREHLFSLMAESSSGFIALAGDTHNAWASHLRTDSNQVVGAEFGGQSVTSSGLESFLRLEPGQDVPIEQGLVGMIDDLAYANVSNRGFMLVTVTPDTAEAEWVYVSDVRNEDYHLLENRGARVSYSKSQRSLSRLESV